MWADLPHPVICVVTRARGDVGSPEREMLLARLVSAAAAGAAIIQVRERLFDDRRLLAFVRAVIAAVRHTGTRVMVNDRSDVALAAGAAGVHLKSHAPSAAMVRRVVPAGFIVGRSVHTEEEARKAASEGGYDYLLAGTVFPSPSKPAGHPTIGVAGLARVCEAVTLPVLAIGGITVDRAEEVAAAGAAGVAAISVFADAIDAGAQVAALSAALTLPGRHV